MKKIIAAVMLSTAALFTAPATAQADDLSFLDTLNDRGFYIYDASLSVAHGWLVCDMLNTANGMDVAAYVYANTRYIDMPDLYSAATFVLTAVEELCPYHDHRGELQRAS